MSFMRITGLLALTTLLMLTFGFSVTAQIAVYIAGDSTAANKNVDRRPETGWGEMLQQHFDPAKVKIDNRALNGRSTKSFVDEGHWQKIIDALKKGDYVFVEFGHNDEKKDKPAVYASPDDYKANLSRFIREVRAKGATPVLLTPVSRRKFEKDVLVKTHGEYPDAVKFVGKAENVAVIDMESKSAAVLTRYGKDGSTKLFLQLKPGEHINYPKGVEDNTHFSPLGAEEMAKLAVEGIRENKIKLARYLKK
ncbi:MAG: rhamnogalacturonan acetylesterase [Pyrinomonadaceae bacterium]